MDADTAPAQEPPAESGTHGCPPGAADRLPERAPET